MNKQQEQKLFRIKKYLRDPEILMELSKDYYIRKRIEGFICENKVISTEYIWPEYGYEIGDKIGFKK